ncbi:N-acylneuraminate cytidylyltransferase [Salegentibacter echinorum]|uniref:N-acylneuraminate cytidylyltransferase n=1 Tax=Salegentibacter echinorum TaxID=1073325 RepID=A0A1M5FFI1_SALEC|nr:pseudaminic acid cytidylyltransferase [Salegentibacter echinorum]SHF90300.1 N-acylneuraminate cytidylyltransferase [Salegentibacter echinorum]
MSKNLCIIPARGGSKRIPRKNIKNFLGKPIIAYSITAALESKLFDEVMVSTDDEEIAEVAKKYGAKVPFMRSQKNADDFATTVDVLLEVTQKYEASDQTFDNICCIYPTAPFTTSVKLKEAFHKLQQEDLDSVFPIMAYSYPIQRSLRLKDDKITFFYPEFEEARSQDLEDAFHDAGQFYFFKTKSLLENKTIFSVKTGGIVINELEAQDIDSKTDWKIAEIKYEFIQSSK